MKFEGVMALALAVLLLTAGCQTTRGVRPTNLELSEAAAKAAEEGDGQEVAVSDPDWDPDKIICKTVETTGSRLSRAKDCRTALQWRQSMSNSARAMSEFRDSAAASLAGPQQ